MVLKLNPRTENTISNLRSFDWFRNVGVIDNEECVVLSDWDEAIKSCSSPDWEDICLEAANEYRQRIFEKNHERFLQWNSIVEIVRPHALSLVQDKAYGIISGFNLPKVFKDTLEWDMIHVLMEAEFSDVYSPDFYAQNAYCYSQGHFPCGWIGNFPQGKLVIY